MQHHRNILLQNFLTQYAIIKEIIMYFAISTLGKILTRQHFETFLVFGLDIICELTPMDTISMKRQNLFGKNEKIYDQCVFC